VFVVYTAAAYRTPDDPRPGMGTAWEPFPGTTPYTRNSELMNAETAAWGRAIVALGLTSNRKLASRQEVRARREEQQQVPQPPKSDVTEAMPWDPPTLAHAVSNGDVPSEPAEDDPMTVSRPDARPSTTRGPPTGCCRDEASADDGPRVPRVAWGAGLPTAG
jgi:hypothetical protein